MGFTFDDTDREGVASPLAEMHRLIAKDPKNAERIFPYIGGEEVNDSPTHAHHRYVINFGDMTEEQARQWPDLMAIVEAKVKPQRMKDNREVRRKYWWRFGETTPALFAAIRGLERVLVIAQTSNTLAFAFKDAKTVFGHTLVIFPDPTLSFFAVLQSRVHQLWALFFAAKMKDDARYIPSDCFETFPFPVGWDSDPDTSIPSPRQDRNPNLQSVPSPRQDRNPNLQSVPSPCQDRNPNLQSAGKEYYEFRAALMVRNNEGLTKTYNRFHDPNERSTDIARLRQLHAAMDRAVLDAYGWSDLQPTCAFLLDYEEDEDDSEGGGRQRKKPWRYRWPDDLRDEVLARLLELNKQRAEQEALLGAADKPKKGRGKKAVRQPPEPPGLF
jgi:hypothetical protein